MPFNPQAASTLNQTNMTGPNSLPTVLVPRFCIENSAMITTTVIGITYGCSDGAAISKPSTADSTEIAGVITPSPKNSAAPNKPSAMIHQRIRGCLTPRCASDINAMMPPSPLLSARMMKVAYFTLTTRISDQKISESTPNTLCGLTCTPCWPNASLNAYSGLVPMSP